MPDFKKILVTGTAGFIGFHLAERLIKEGYDVYGLDVINDYYDINLKFARLAEHGIRFGTLEGANLETTPRYNLTPSSSNHSGTGHSFYNQIVNSSKYENYRFIRLDLADHDTVVSFMVEQKFDYVVNLAAQAGVRYSIDNPRAYTHSNIDGFLSVLEGARYSKVKHLIYASTSSVYGLNTEMPLSESQMTDRPMALYAATKKANELFAHSYSHLFDLPTTGLRFFTVYGPWGRPDMALFLFADAMLKDEPINVFNHGKMIRDFTYVDDIVESITRLIPRPPAVNRDRSLSDSDGSQNSIEGPKPLTPRYNLTPSSSNHSGTASNAPAQVFNIGNSAPVELMAYIEALEKALGKTAKKNYMDIQAGDVPATHADVSKLEEYVNFRPKTSVEEGVKRFVDWYLESKSKKS
jgi:UDP-glucuronate 4-epimerase